MQTHARRGTGPTPERVPARHGPDTGRPEGSRADAGRAQPRPDAPLSAEGVLDLQATAGNRATTQVVLQRLAVQRLSIEGAEGIARRLEDAMSGLGTDEEAIYGALSGRTGTDMQAIREAYQHLYRKSLDAELEDELSGGELEKVRRMMAPVADETALPDDQQAAAKVGRAKVIAQQIHDAMQGAGTEEDQIYNALEGRTPSEVKEIKKQYRELYGHALDRDLLDELSGDELRKAMNLALIADAGTFTNSFTQEMTEGETTGASGRFEWSLEQDHMRVEAPVKIVPDAGVNAPIARWNAEIASTWNQFAAIEPGGLKIPIEISMRNDPGDSRTIVVHKNKTAGVVSPEDRANAGEWYETMDATTAPHEFGHYIGLQDEYQRTPGDYRKVTGEAPAVGPVNRSGKTEAEIATELHDALYLDDATRRAPTATALLRSVGLIAAGVPQQGDFAQAVKRAYDDKYSGWFSKNLVEAMRDKLPENQKWTIQTVFSFASRTIMGNPEALSAPGAAAAPHDHAVEPRHMREFLAIIRRTWPTYTWSIGPK